MCVVRRFPLCLVTVVVCYTAMAAQTDSTSFSIRGSIGVTYDLYSINSDGPRSVSPRRPPTVLRLTADPTIELGDVVEIPIHIALTFREASVIQPQIPDPDIGSFIQNPLNRISVSPRFGWATLHLGSLLPRYGTLTISNAQIFGMGFDFAPSPLRISGSYGILNRAVQVDTVNGRRGSYARSILAIRIANEQGSNSAFGLTVSRMTDDRTSIPFVTEVLNIPVPIVDSNGVVVKDSAYSLITRDSLQPLAQEGISLGMDFKTNIGDGGFINAELAGSAFTRDQDAPVLEESLPVIDLFMTSRTSTRLDVAGLVEGGYNDRSWGVKGGITYIGPGYVSLSQPFLQQDRIDVTVTPRFNVFNGRLTGSATVGWRMNDLIKSLDNGSTQLLLNIATTALATDDLTLSATFTNFGYRQTRNIDSIRYEQVTTSFSIMPTYVFGSGSLRHVVSGSFGLDSFDDLTAVGTPSSSNTTISATAAYSISPRSADWSARLVAAFVTNDLVSTRTTMQSVTLGGMYRMLYGTLTPDAAITLSNNVITGLPSETQITLRGGASWVVVNSLQLVGRLQLNTVTSSDTVAGRSYDEILATIGIRWSF